MSMQIIFLFVANPASQMSKSVFRLKLSYEHPANRRRFQGLFLLHPFAYSSSFFALFCICFSIIFSRSDGKLYRLWRLKRNSSKRRIFSLLSLSI